MKKAAIIVAMLLLLGGCGYSAEPDSKAFITAIGIDKGESEELRFTFVIMSPSKSGEDSEGGDADETIVTEANSLYSAIEKMNAFKSKKLELTHTQTIVFSDSLAEEGIKDFIYDFVRSDSFRPNIYVCIAENSAKDFLENVKPTETKSLEKYFRMIFSKMSSGSYGEMYLYGTYFDLLNESGVSVLPYCTVKKEEESESGSENETESGKSSEGSVKSGENPARIQGSAVLKDGIYRAVLDRDETKILQLIKNGFPESYVTLSDPDSPGKTITLHLTQSEKTRIEIQTYGAPKIEVKMYLGGDLTEAGSRAEYSMNSSLLEHRFEEELEKSALELLKRSAKELDCDICAFSEEAKLTFLTAREWEDYAWGERYKNAEFIVKAELNIKSEGEISGRVR